MASRKALVSNNDYMAAATDHMAMMSLSSWRLFQKVLQGHKTRLVILPTDPCCPWRMQNKDREDKQAKEGTNGKRQNKSQNRSRRTLLERYNVSWA